MATSNANYLTNPSKLSTKVAYAPGGASSLSLAWDSTPTNPVRQKSRSQQPSMQYKPVEAPPLYSQEQLSPSMPYYEPLNPGYINMTESNRILEEELQYYQRRNKMLRQNIFGGHQNLEQVNSLSARNPQYGGYYNNHNPRPMYEKGQSHPYSLYYNQNQLKYHGSNQELDLAVMQQSRKRGKQRVDSQGSYGRQYNSPIGRESSEGGYEKTSVKVSHPPGGRSSIVFG